MKQLGYDKFEQRVFLAYGNGTKTTYNYEPERRRLQNMVAKTNAGRIMMDNVYGYDKVNNILSLKNNAPIPSSNLMGGSSDYTYAYDDLYRLTSAEGTFKGSNDEHNYTLDMSYNSVGGILEKNQVHKRKGQVQKKTTYDFEYTYGEEQPNAPTHIGEQAYTYDKNGNQTGWTHDVSGQRRKILWDEENRMRSLYDNGAAFHYIYDAAGERVLKGRSKGQSIYVDAESKGGSGNMSNFTVYVNPYIVLKSGGYTKHYYIEGQRIVSKLGGGWDNKGQGPLKAGGDKVDYAGKKQKMHDGIVKNLKFLGMDGQVLTAGKSGKIPPGQLNGGSISTSESFQYYYHPDHLGSTSYMTDASGEVYQHLEYFAFGETFVEEHSNTDRTPYLYNGKELDEETGLYYYGARYYDPRTSVFITLDPLTEKIPGITPYNFAYNNPLIFIDPTGAFGEYYDDNGNHLGSDGNNDDNKVYVAKSVTKDDKGVVTSADGAKDLGVTHDQFATSANVVKHESSGNKDESLWIAHAANNAKDNDAIDWRKQNTTLNDQLTDKSYSTTPESARTPLSTTDNSNAANNARAVVVNVLTGGADPTGGATLWDGSDFLKKGSSHNKFKEYSNISIDKTHLQKYAMEPKRPGKSIDGTFWVPIIFKTNYESQGSGKYNSLQSTGAQGRSIFWKIGPK